MQTDKIKLEINKCISLGDAKRVKRGLEPIRNKLQLAIELSKIYKKPVTGIYSRLYRYELNGFYTEDEKFVNHLIDFLGVKRKHLVVKYEN